MVSQSFFIHIFVIGHALPFIGFIGVRLMNRATDDKYSDGFRIGNTSIKIKDDYCREKTKEDVDAILRRISASTSMALNLPIKSYEELP